MKHSFRFIYLIAIVVVIIFIVTLGLFIMKSSQNFVDSVDLSLTDSNEFNNMWTVYKGKQKGSDVCRMLQKVINNAKENGDNPSMLVDIACNVHASDEFTIINSTKKMNRIDEIQELMSDIDVKHYYTIEFVYSENSKQITGIVIKYAEKDKINFVPDEN
jgi:hypothetical protein